MIHVVWGCGEKGSAPASRDNRERGKSMYMTCKTHSKVLWGERSGEGKGETHGCEQETPVSCLSTPAGTEPQPEHVP